MLARIAAAAALAAAAYMAGCDEEEGAPAASSTDYGKAPQAGAVATDPPEAADQQGRKRWNRAPEMKIDTSKTYLATIKTNLGEIQVELFDDAAPKTVNNFVFLAREDFYDGTIFHRVINNFMIQGGDPTGTGMGDPGYSFEDELKQNPHKHEPFTLSMANAGPNTNGSQFFITEVATPHLDGRHTVFGRVIQGKEVVEKISDVAVGPMDRPREDVVIEDVTIEEKGAADEKPATRPAEEPTTRPAG
jgi:peptidyl-prolyl cis-trans isomerase B (cyclophilin B)